MYIIVSGPCFTADVYGIAFTCSFWDESNILDLIYEKQKYVQIFIRNIWLFYSDSKNLRYSVRPVLNGGRVQDSFNMFILGLNLFFFFTTRVKNVTLNY